MPIRPNAPRLAIASSLSFLMLLAACQWSPPWDRLDDDSTTDPNASPSPSGQVAAPAFSPEDGDFSSARTISIETETEGASVYYTLNGADPVSGAAGTYRYTGPIALDAVNPDRELKAIAKHGGMSDSAIRSAEYHLSYDRGTTGGTLPVPEISPVSAVRTSTQIKAATTIPITITCPGQPDADIYYYTGVRWDGVIPTPFGDPDIPEDSDGNTGHPPFSAYYVGHLGAKLYTGPIAIPANASREHFYIKAIAVRGGWADSPIARTHYRQSGYPNVESFTLNGSSNMESSGVGERVSIDIVYQDDADTLDAGLGFVRISCRKVGHGTTSEGLDPTMLYFEWSAASPDSFSFYDDDVTTLFGFGEDNSQEYTHYAINSADCSAVIDSSPHRQITLHFEFTPLEAAYDAVDAWKNRKSFWTWMCDDYDGSDYTNNPVEEMGRWELTGP